MTLSDVGPPLDQARRTSPWTVGVELAGLLALVPVVVIDILTDPGPELIQFGIAAIVLGVRALGWWFRTYTVTEAHLELDEGILNRRHRAVPYSRVQQIDIRQPLIQRFLGVASLHLETAGEGGATAVVLRVLSRDDAETLRRFVLQRRDWTALAPSTAAPPTAVPVLHVRPGQVFLAGLTELSVMLVALTAAAAFLAFALGVAAIDQTDTALGVFVVALVVTLVLAAVIVMTAVGFLFQYGDFTLTVTGDDLHVRRGLLQVQEQTIPRVRVQQTSVVDNPVRRALGVAAVLLHSAAPPNQTRGQGNNDLRIPLIRRADVNETLATVLGPQWAPPPLVPRSDMARRRAVRRRCLLLLVLTAPTIVLLPATFLGIPWGRAAHRRAGFGATSFLAGFASGVLHHRLDLVPRRRIQSTRLSASPFQRRLGLRTLWLDVAGTRLAGPFTRSPHLHDLTDESAMSGMYSLEVGA